ncbi:MAG: FAD-dependent oxidoreductase, partial [Bacteroidota bacterium]
DVDRLRPSIAEGKKAVIVGGGYIGLEVAAVAKSLGLDVTVIETFDRVLMKLNYKE